MAAKMISVVVSAYNEEEMLPEFYKAVSDVLAGCSWEYELLFVNDGSVDRTREILAGLAQEDPRVKVISFSRNFGHEAAMIAGIDYAHGDGIVCMDADLQHPPQYIPQIIEKFEEGCEVVSMVRLSREDAGLVKKLTSETFYKVLNRFSTQKFENNASDYFAVSRKAADVLRSRYRENVRYLRGYVQSLGFPSATINYRAGRREAGESHYRIRDLIRFSVQILCNYSDFPLKLGIYFAAASACIGLITLIAAIISAAAGAGGGILAVITVLLFLASAVFLLLGIQGEYINVMFAELKDRPIYIVEETIHLEERTLKDVRPVRKW